VPLCIYQANTSRAATLGLITDEGLINLADAGGPATLSEALQLSLADLRRWLNDVAETSPPTIPLEDVTLRAPIDRQEVWAAGVTYRRSRDARMEESTQKDVYALVYQAERPEIFLKATPSRVSGPGEPVGIRGDSTWDVPEPEIAVYVNSTGEILGYTIGNDVSSRSIEGENPLYLPQAKIYRMCAALGPVIALPWEVDDPGMLPIVLEIFRDGARVFLGSTSTDQMHREFADLVRYVLRCQEGMFPDGFILMTGTGIIPPSEFTLEDGDEVQISVEGIGQLRNAIVRLPFD